MDSRAGSALDTQDGRLLSQTRKEGSVQTPKRNAAKRTRNGIDTVSARELHEKLGVGRDYSHWIKDRVEKFRFQEGVDYTTCSPNLASELHGGQNRIEYYLTIDMAKELAMVENNEQGRKIRRYFIEVEKAYRKQRELLPTVKQVINNPIDTNFIVFACKKRIICLYSLYLRLFLRYCYV